MNEAQRGAAALAGAGSDAAAGASEAKRQLLARLLAEKAQKPKTYPASFGQQRIWFLHQLEPLSAAYNIPCDLFFDGDIDVPALAQAVNEVLRRHESLRTRFDVVEGEPVQVVDPPSPFALEVEDLREWEPAEAPDADAKPRAQHRAEAVRRSAERLRQPFDLVRGPLFRARLYRFADDGWLLHACMHHTVSDGWSTSIYHRELTTLYNDLKAGDPPSLAAPKLQYADYAAWQRSYLSGEELERQIGWWKALLEEAPQLIDLPTDRPRAAMQSQEGGSYGFRLKRPDLALSQALARSESATPFMIYLAAWALLLYRYAGQDRVVVGTPVLGRPRAELEEVIGYFVNTLALPVDCSGNPSFRQLVRRVRELMLGAYAHQEVPFERLVDELKVERSLDHNPVYQVLFTYHSIPAPAVDMDGARSQLVTTDTAASQADLFLGVVEGSDGVHGRIEYSKALFESDTVVRVLRHFERLLAAALEDPDGPVARLPLMPDDEREQVLEASRREPPPATATLHDGCDTTIHALFERQAAERPDAVALRFGDERLSYGELNARANRLARHLRALGVGPEVAALVCLERTPALVTALLAVLKAGGAYVPVEPTYPAARVRAILEDSRAHVVLTQAHLAAALFSGPPEGTVHVVRVDGDAAAIAAYDAGDLPPLAMPENVAYAIFTSGSTGRPKGVQIEHRQTSAVLHWLREQVSDDDLRAVLGSTSITFDVSVAEIFGTLCWGGTLVLVENALSLASLPAGVEVRLAAMVPSAGAELLRMNGIPAGVRRIHFGGEPLPNPLAQAVFALTGVEEVVNLYGPTEDTTYSTFHPVRPGDERVTLGRPLANGQAYVLDRHLEPVPVGVPGELYLAGAGLARGYLGRPAMTAEKWLPHPYAAEPGARMYRTGDRARWLADGTLEYLGRLDHQVKVRGFRIETGEIEAVLATHPGVRQAVVTARPDASGERRLVAYFTADAGEVSGAELRVHLRERLPDYMVPAVFVPLESLPLTPSGKVDRRSLPEPEAPSSAESYVAPRDATEEALAALWMEVLGVPRVGVADNFFELGGHSLRAAQVIARVRAALEVEVPLRAMFESPTVAGLALEVEKARAGAGAKTQSISRISREGRRASLSSVSIE